MVGIVGYPGNKMVGVVDYKTSVVDYTASVRSN